MTQIEVSSLQVGNHLQLVSLHANRRGMVDMVTDEGNYVRIAWHATKRPDILSRTSPLWLMMELLP